MAAGIDLSGRTTGETAIAWLTGEPGGRPSLTNLPSTRGLRGQHGDARLSEMILDGRLLWWRSTLRWSYPIP